MRISACLLVIVSACSVQTIDPESRTPTPPRVSQTDDDPAQAESDGVAKADFDGVIPDAPVGTGNLSVTVLPASTGKDVALAAIRSATATLDAGLYLVTEYTIVQAFIAAKERGVAVRIVIDDSDNTRSGNKNALAKWAAAGIDVVKATGFSYHHAKYLVVDGKSALVMTCNFTVSSFASNREVVVSVSDAELVADLSTIFAADFIHESPEISATTRLVISPINAREKLNGLIGNAKQRVFFAMQSVDDNDTVALLIARHDAGVDVRVMMADPTVYDQSGDADVLKAHGIDVRYLPETILYLHEKVIVADDDAFVGSVNITYTSIEKNREIGVIGDASFTSLVLPQVQADWDMAVSF